MRTTIRWLYFSSHSSAFFHSHKIAFACDFRAAAKSRNDIILEALSTAQGKAILIKNCTTTPSAKSGGASARIEAASTAGTTRAAGTTTAGVATTRWGCKLAIPSTPIRVSTGAAKNLPSKALSPLTSCHAFIAFFLTFWPIKRTIRTLIKSLDKFLIIIAGIPRIKFRSLTVPRISIQQRQLAISNFWRRQLFLTPHLTIKTVTPLSLSSLSLSCTEQKEKKPEKSGYKQEKK